MCQPVRDRSRARSRVSECRGDIHVRRRDPMAKGTVKKLVSDRGFGFLVPEDEPATGKDLYFHRVDVQGSGYDVLREGEQVLYDLGTDERRGTPKATNVRAVLESN